MTTKTILALIHTGNLSDNELVVASVKASNHLRNKMWNLWGMKSGITKEKTELLNWLGVFDSTPIQTSKDLRTLEKQFKGKGMAVYLHEKEAKVCSECGIDEPTQTVGTKGYCCMTGNTGETLQIKKPLMLAVFGNSAVIKETLGMTTAPPTAVDGEDEIRRLLE